MSFENDWEQFRENTRRNRDELSLASSKGENGNGGGASFKYEESSLEKAGTTLENEITPRVKKAGDQSCKSIAGGNLSVLPDWKTGKKLKDMHQIWSRKNKKLQNRLQRDRENLAEVLRDYRDSEQEIKRSFTRRGDSRINRI